MLRNFRISPELTGFTISTFKLLLRIDLLIYFTYFMLQEGLLGDCETAYVIEHHPYDRSHNIVLNITKARDFHNCRTRPNQVYGREYYGFECGKNDDEKAVSYCYP